MKTLNLDKTKMMAIMAATLVVAGLSYFWASPQQAAGAPQTGLDVEKVAIVTAAGVRHEFNLEVARTPEQQNTGMMFRTGVADDGGMLFVFDPPREARFWMKNTLIPLDIIFVSPAGEIISIAAKAKPESLDEIPSGGVAGSVIEIRGGLAAEKGIAAGDRVEHAYIEYP